MCTVLLLQGFNSITVNKYINISIYQHPENDVDKKPKRVGVVIKK